MSATQQSPVDFAQLQYLRQVLAPQYAILPSTQIRGHMEAQFGPESADLYDQYLEWSLGDLGRGISRAVSDVGRFAARAAPAAAQIGGGALQGALSGARFGLPGIIGGAALGGAGAGLQRLGGGTARDIGGVLSGITNIAGQASPLGRLAGGFVPAITGLVGGGRGGAAGAATSALNGILGAFGGGGGGGGLAGAAGALLGSRGGPAGGLAGALAGGPAGGQLAGLLGRVAPAAGALAGLFGGGGATGQLMSLLQRPETAQALAALNLGPLGRSMIPIGSPATAQGAGAAQRPQVQVPAVAFPKLIEHLSEQIVAEATQWTPESEGVLDYMTDQEGAYVGDPALDRDRAARLWNLLNESLAERVLEALSTADWAAPGAGPPAERDGGGERYDESPNDGERYDESLYDAMDLEDAYAASADLEAYLEYGSDAAGYARHG